MTPLTFRQFQKLNRLRCEQAFRPLSGKGSWPIQNWALALAGETGEFCNLVKKLIRGDLTLAARRTAILKELADIITYADLTISFLNADTAVVLMDKFDEVSARVGWHPEVDVEP